MVQTALLQDDMTGEDVRVAISLRSGGWHRLPQATASRCQQGDWPGSTPGHWLTTKGGPCPIMMFLVPGLDAFITLIVFVACSEDTVFR